MLGRLARWLRYMGYDAAYDAGLGDSELARRALAEERVLLTRDRELLDRWRLPGALYVASDRPEQQLRQVASSLGLAAQPRARCTVCNSILCDAEPREVAAQVPLYVLRHETRFTRCPGCRRVYWAGTHDRRMRETLCRALLP
jgi:uncharacterized protein with PIN domain